MKIITKILYIVMAILALILILIIASAINPGISSSIGSLFPEDFHVSLPSFHKEEPETVTLEDHAKKVNEAGTDISTAAASVASAATDGVSEALDNATQAVGAAGKALENAADALASASAELSQPAEVLPVVDGQEPTGSAEAEGTANKPDTDGGNSSDSGPVIPTETELELLKRSGLNNGINITYLRPSEKYIETPAGVETGGYINLNGTYETVDPIRADELRGLAGTGNLGQGLTFDAKYYPYYQMLDDVGKTLYRQIYANAMDLYAPFSPAVACSQYQLDNAFEAVYCDHPELFWIDAGYYGWVTYGGEVIQAEIIFYPTAGELTAAQNTFHTESNRIINAATGTDYEKEKFVHDAIAGSVIYDLYSDMNQSAYSALVGGKTVCAGYARAMQYILQQLSIPCYYCHGFAGEEHAWNIVCLDGAYYNVDPTWDDQGNEISYAYFNRSDSDLSLTHARRDLSVYLPACHGTEFRGLEDTSYYPSAELPDGTHDISDYSLTEEDILTSLEAYNDDCRQRISTTGAGEYTFWNAVADQAVLDEIDAEYDKNENLPFMSGLPFSWQRYRIHVEYYPLSNGGFAIQNIVKIQ